MAKGLQIIWTPWRNHDELLAVRQWLFNSVNGDEGGDQDRRRKACVQISAWKLRGNLPHAVESSWLLSEAIMADALTAPSISVFAIKASYITAISRFVTGLLDAEQDSKYKVSMYSKAQQIGLPALFVDIRHEATHGEMPSLITLRQAAPRAMQWLWDDYWCHLAESSGPEKPTTERKIQGTREDGENEDDGKDGQVGGWKQWQGEWRSKPIGIVP